MVMFKTQERTGFTPLEISRRRRLPMRLRIGSITGFTLIEMLVIISIILIFSTILIGYSREAGKQLLLVNNQANLVSLISRAKSLSIATFIENTALPLSPSDPKVCGYGVHIEKGAGEAFIFRDLAQDCSSGDNRFGSGDVKLTGQLDIFKLDPVVAEFGSADTTITPTVTPSADTSGKHWWAWDYGGGDKQYFYLTPAEKEQKIRAMQWEGGFGPLDEAPPSAAPAPTLTPTTQKYEVQRGYGGGTVTFNSYDEAWDYVKRASGNMGLTNIDQIGGGWTITPTVTPPVTSPTTSPGQTPGTTLSDIIFIPPDPTVIINGYRTVKEASLNIETKDKSIKVVVEVNNAGRISTK